MAGMVNSVSSSVETGYEFLVSLVHGLRGNGFHGERLEALASAATEESFLRQLQWPEATLGCSFAKVASSRQLRILNDICKRLSGKWAEFYRWFFFSSAIGNLRLIMNSRYLKTQEEEDIYGMLVEIPGMTHDQFDALLKCKSTETFIVMLEHLFQIPEISEIIRDFEKEGNMMRAECRLEQFDFHGELACARALPMTVRFSVVQAVQMEIDISNTLMLLRNIETYHLPADEARHFFLEGGNALSEKCVPELCKCQTVQEAFERMPRAWARTVCGEEKNAASLHSFENSLWKKHLAFCNHVFYDFSTPESGILMYPYLLRFETVNLCRIYEGIRFGLPARVIRELLIDSEK